MRNQLNQLKSLFEQVRVLGIEKQLPQEHNRLSDNISLYFADNYDVSSIDFGKPTQQVEFMKYSTNSNDYRVSFRINATDEELNGLIDTITAEFKLIKIEWLKEQLNELETEVLV